MPRHVLGASYGRRVVGMVALVAGIALLGPSGAPPPAPSSASAATLPSGFTETTVFSGLTNPTVVRFAADGRVFVAEKGGLIKVFDSLTDTTPTTFADLRTNVHNFWDRGLLGMTLAPNFPDLAVRVRPLHLRPPRSAGADPRSGATAVPTPPGPTTDGCVVSGRLSRLQANGNVMTGAEQVLVEDWCQQYPSHSVGTVEFGPEGALYASGGDGASFNFVDYGQDGSPLNPCGDPPGGVGATLTPPTAEGGALRAQDLRTSGDPVGLDGSIIRVDPATGAGLPTNPLGRELRSERPPDHRPRPAQPLPLHLPPGDERALGRGRGLERLGGDQPHPGPDRRHGRELRLALLRGQSQAVGLRRRQPEHLREPVRQPERGHEALLRLQPREQGRPLGGLSHRQLLDRGHVLRVQPERQHLPRSTTRGRSSSPTTRGTASG